MLRHQGPGQGREWGWGAGEDSWNKTGQKSKEGQLTLIP